MKPRVEPASSRRATEGMLKLMAGVSASSWASATTERDARRAERLRPCALASLGSPAAEAVTVHAHRRRTVAVDRSRGLWDAVERAARASRVSRAIQHESMQRVRRDAAGARSRKRLSSRSRGSTCVRSPRRERRPRHGRSCCCRQDQEDRARGCDGAEGRLPPGARLAVPSILVRRASARDCL